MDAMLEFESAHRVESYTLQGLNIWPYLRTNTAWRRLNETGIRIAPNRMVHTRDRLVRYSRFWLKDRSKNSSNNAGHADVAIVTHTNRRERIGGVYWHALADPLALEFEKRGVKTRIYEQGPAKWPRARPSKWVSRDFKLMRLLGRLGPRLAVPPWFSEYATWASEFLGKPVTWDAWETYLREMFALAEYFENTFRRSGTKAVFVDCWYALESLAAILAARRLKLLSIELQHGLQGSQMSGYAGWSNEYEMIPQLFWVWGGHAAAALHERNRVRFRSVVGGNVWLNTWRRASRPNSLQAEVDCALHMRGGAALAVLVTLQQGIDLQPVFSAIAQSPHDWKWLIRIHRKMRTPEFEAQLKTTLMGVHPGILIDEPSNLPLYAVLSSIDVHVTGFSTCALEALAFGKPTVAFSANAHDAFGDLLYSGAIEYADSSGAILKSIETLRHFEPARAFRLADAHYAGENSTARATDMVVEEMHR